MRYGSRLVPRLGIGAISVPMIPQLLDRVGIVYRWRAAMRLILADLREPPNLRAGYSIVPWDLSRLDEVAGVDQLAYEGTVDGQLYRTYFATADGCKRMWRESISGRFGRFDAERSLLLVRGSRICGDVMASLTGPKDAFIGNLAIHPQDRGGTGRALLLTCLWRYREAGYERVSLAVTFDNQRAFRLYQTIGFHVVGRFPIVTWSNPLSRPAAAEGGGWEVTAAPTTSARAMDPLPANREAAAGDVPAEE
jgi:ribosomal protein S18 acetylase RimI-like enzyme